MKSKNHREDALKWGCFTVEAQRGSASGGRVRVELEGEDWLLSSPTCGSLETTLPQPSEPWEIYSSYN